jgi:hypothetical protein
MCCCTTCFLAFFGNADAASVASLGDATVQAHPSLVRTLDICLQLRPSCMAPAAHLHVLNEQPLQLWQHQINVANSAAAGQAERLQPTQTQRNTDSGSSSSSSSRKTR